MSFSILEIFNRSVTIEAESDAIFRQAEPFDVFINGEKKLSTDSNVFTVTGLLPDTKYTLKVASAEGIWEKEFDKLEQPIFVFPFYNFGGLTHIFFVGELCVFLNPFVELFYGIEKIRRS